MKWLTFILVSTFTWVTCSTEAEHTAPPLFLRVVLQGDDPNRFGIGATVEVQTFDGQRMVQEMTPHHGDSSSTEPVLLFDLGDAEGVHVIVTWPDGSRETLIDVPTNQTLTVYQAHAVDQ